MHHIPLDDIRQNRCYEKGKEWLKLLESLDSDDITIAQGYMKINLKVYFVGQIQDEDLYNYFPNNLSYVKFMDLSKNQITSDGLYRMAQMQLVNLQYLSLRNNNLDQRAGTIIASFNCPKLKILKVGNDSSYSSDRSMPYQNQIGNQGFEPIIWGEWPQLLILDCSKIVLNKCDLAGLTNISWTNLVSLTLNDNSISLKGIKQLIKVDFSKMTSLSLNGCGLGDQSLTQVSKIKRKELKVFNLGRNPISNRGIKHLGVGHWMYLKHITFNITEDSLDCLRHISRLETSQLQKYPIQMSSVSSQYYWLDIRVRDYLRVEEERLQNRVKL